MTVTATPSNGFTGTVTGSFSGLPAGVTVSPSNFSIAVSSSAPATAQVQLSLTSGAAPGTSAISVSTNSGSLSQNAQFNLVVNLPGVSVVLTPGTVSLTLGSNQTVQVSAVGLNGFSGTLTATVTGLPSGVTAVPSTFPVNTNTSVLVQFSASNSAAAASVTATIALTNGAVSGSATLPLTVSTAGDFQISSTTLYFSVSQSAYVPFIVGASAVNGFSSPITVSFSNLPEGITISPSTFTLLPGTSKPLKLTADFTAAPTPTSSDQFTITGTSGNITHSTNYSLNVYATTDIGLQIRPSIAVEVPAGTATSIELSANPGLIGHGVGTIAFTVGPIPAGLTVSPTTFNMPGNGGTQQIYVSVDPTAAPTADFFPISWSFGPLQKTAYETIDITAAPQFQPVPLTKAQLFVRTATPPLTPARPTFAMGPQFLVYHAATGRFFSTDQGMNRLNVIDGTTHTLSSVLTIPGAFGIDQAPDGSVLFVGTIQGDLYIVDPINLAVTRRYASSQIGPNGFVASMVYALSNGQLLLYTYANQTLAMWDPATNAIVYFQTSGSPTGQFCLGGGSPVFLTRGRTRLIVSPSTYSSPAETVCSFDPVADTFTVTPTIADGSPVSSLSSFAQTPDGLTVIAGNGINLYDLDSATMAIKNSFPVPFAHSNQEFPSLLASSDNSNVFVPDTSGADILDEYDLSSGQMAGWIPQPAMNDLSAFPPLATPQYQAMDANGIAAGVMNSGGVGFLDTRQVHVLPVGSHMSQMPLDTAYGPVAGGTQTEWSAADLLSGTSTLGSIYFGDNAATEIGPASANTGFGFDATSPAGAAGPADVRVFTVDGDSQFIPEGFSYGPWVVEPVTGYATADGGGPASLFGYGFGPQSLFSSSVTYVNPPPELQVLVGGNQAQVTGFNPEPTFHYANGFAPLPVNSMLYTVPAGVAGNSATLTVTNSSGSTSSSTLTYLPAVQSYAVSGQLVDGVYDAKRDVYYFSDTNQVRVFSATQKAWLPSIAIPAPQNASASQRLWGLALSPDGSKLAITDAGAAAVYLLDPDSPSSVQSFPLTPVANWSSYEAHAVAVTNAGVIYFSDTSSPLNELDSTTGMIATILSVPDANDADARFLMTPDGSTIYFNDSGLGMLSVAGGTVTRAGGCVLNQALLDLAMNPAATRLFYAGCLMDSNLNTFGLQALNLAESIDANYAYGGAFSSTGELFFQPGMQSIDVFDGNTGAFLSRVSLPAPLSTNYRALISDGKDSTIVAITGTGNGIAVIDLNSIPEPSTPGYLTTLPGPFNIRNHQRSLGSPRQKGFD
jgi:hypothetical protein